LEFVQGQWIAAAELFKAWGEFCGENGIVVGSAKAFSIRIKRRVQHEPNHGRPRYAGIQFKAKGAPRLKVVSG
jgi:hypothetical protein